MKLRIGALQDREARQRRPDIDPLALGNGDVCRPDLRGVLEEGMRMWFALDIHPGPPLCHYVDMRYTDMAVLLREMVSHD